MTPIPLTDDFQTTAADHLNDHYALPLEAHARRVWIDATGRLPDDLQDAAGAGVEQMPYGPPAWYLGGLYAAHTIRLYGVRDLFAREEGGPMWAVPLEPAGPRGKNPAQIISAGKVSERMRLASDILHVHPSTSGSLRDVWGQDLARWLSASPDVVAACSLKLVRHCEQAALAGDREKDQMLHLWRQSWWAVHGSGLATALDLDDAGGKPGRPWGDDQRLRAWQQTVALGMTSALRWTKKYIAESVGISRTTLDAWTGGISDH